MMRFLVLVFLVTAEAYAQQTSSASYEGIVSDCRALLASQKFDAAVTACEKGILLDPSRWEAYALTGSALALQHQFERAISYLEKAISIAPTDRKPSLQSALDQAKAAGTQPRTQQTTPATPAQAEIVLWKSIESSTNPTDFEAYLHQYPEGVFAELAKSRLSALQQRQKAERSKADVDNERWKAVAANPNKATLEAYKNEFPNGSHAAEATTMLNELSRVIRYRAYTWIVAAMNNASPGTLILKRGAIEFNHHDDPSDKRSLSLTCDKVLGVGAGSGARKEGFFYINARSHKYWLMADDNAARHKILQDLNEFACPGSLK